MKDKYEGSTPTPGQIIGYRDLGIESRSVC